MDNIWFELVMNEKLPVDTLIQMISEFNTSFAEMQGKFPAIAKNSTSGNRGGKEIKHTDFSALRDATSPIMSEHGISIEQDITGELQNLYMQTIIRHKNGYFEVHNCPIAFDESMTDPKEYGKTRTYYKRYTYVTLLCLSTPEKDLDDQITDVNEKKKDELLSEKQIALFNRKDKEHPGLAPLILKRYKIESINEMHWKYFNEALKTFD